MSLVDVQGLLRDALPSGGTAHCRVHTDAPGPYIVIEQVSSADLPGDADDRMPDEVLASHDAIAAALNDALAAGTLGNPDELKYYDVQF